MRNITQLIVWIVVLTGCATRDPHQSVTTANSQTGPIIDMHVHAVKWDQFGDPPPPNPASGKRPLARTDKDAMDASLAEMKRHNIVLAVVSGPLETLRLWRESTTNRLYFGITIEAGSLLPPIATLREEFRAGRLHVLGELGLQYEGIAPDDPRLEPYFALAEELGIPVAVHTGSGPPAQPTMALQSFA